MTPLFQPPRPHSLRRRDCWNLALLQAKRARRGGRRRKGLGLLAVAAGAFLSKILSGYFNSLVDIPRVLSVLLAQSFAARRLQPKERPDMHGYLPKVPPTAKKIVKDIDFLQRRAGSEDRRCQQAWRRLEAQEPKVAAYLRQVDEAGHWYQLKRELRVPVLFVPAPSDRRLHDEHVVAVWSALPRWRERGRALMRQSAASPEPAPDRTPSPSGLSARP